MSIKRFDLPDLEVDVSYTTFWDGQSQYTVAGRIPTSWVRGMACIADREQRSPIAGTTLLPHLGYYRGDYEMKNAPASATTTRRSDPRSYTVYNGYVSARAMGPDALGWTSVDPLDWDECDALVQAAFANCRANLDLSTTLAEAHKTATMVRNVHKDLRRMLKQGMTHGFGANLALDARMQWRYGWRLLSYDLQSVVELLHKPLSGTVVTGKAQNAMTQKQWTTHDSQSYTNAIVSWTDTFRQERQLRANAAVYYRTQTPNVAWSVPVTAWELVPLSWVLDLFVNIGSLLEAWDVINHADAYTASVGVLQTDYHEGSCTYESTPTHLASSGRGVLSEKRVQRARYPHGVPSILPHIRVRLTSATLLDIASLLKKRLRVPAAIMAVTLGTLQGGD